MPGQASKQKAPRLKKPGVEPPRPTIIDVSGRTYVVQWLSEHDWAQLHEADDHRGYTDSINNTIYMRTFEGRVEGDAACAGSLQSTMVHELLHAMATANGMEDMKKMVDALDEDDATEWLVEGLANPVLYLITHNPRLMEWLNWRDI